MKECLVDTVGAFVQGMYIQPVQENKETPNEKTERNEHINMSRYIQVFKSHDTIK